MLELANRSNKTVSFSIVPNRYTKDGPTTYHLPPHGHRTHTVLGDHASSNGWYDVSVTISGDDSWSRRYVGHLEDGRNSSTG